MSDRRTHCALVTTRIYDYDHSEPFRASITDAHSCGTCFAVSMPEPFGVILLTNHHCVADVGPKNEVTLSFEHIGGPMHLPATIQRVCPELDFAVLQCEAALEYMEPMRAHLAPLHMSESEMASAKTTRGIAIQGFPLGDNSQVRTAWGSYAGSNDEYIQLSASINKGNSGGAVQLRESGKAIGIATASIAATEGIALAVPLYHVLSALRRADKTLIRVPKLANLHLAPQSKLDACLQGGRVLEPWGPLKTDDIISRIGDFDVSPHTARIRIPHCFSGAAPQSVEAALALPVNGPVPVIVHRKGVQQPLTLNVTPEVQVPPDTIFPRWETPGGVHYIMFGQVGSGALCFAPKSSALLDDFDMDLEDKTYTAALCAPSGCMMVVWLEPNGEAERLGIECLSQLTHINGKPAKTPEECAAAVTRAAAHKRPRRKQHATTTFTFGKHSYVLPTQDFQVHRY